MITNYGKWSADKDNGFQSTDSLSTIQIQALKK